jgi:hypothetical protein
MSFLGGRRVAVSSNCNLPADELRSERVLDPVRVICGFLTRRYPLDVSKQCPLSQRYLGRAENCRQYGSQRATLSFAQVLMYLWRTFWDAARAVAILS